MELKLPMSVETRWAEQLHLVRNVGADIVTKSGCRLREQTCKIWEILDDPWTWGRPVYKI